MLEFLKAASQFAEPTGATAFPEEIAGFALEYATTPDIGVERARISALLGGDKFDLFAFSDDDPDLLILLFPGIVLEQSPEFLFHESEDLRAALDLLSVTPEIPSQYSGIERKDTESIGGIIDAICKSNAESPSNANWALELIKADLAWAKHGVNGNGVRIGQPDTGVADHDELNSGLNKHMGHNYLDGVRDPTDPLLSSMRAPGHGTRTSSSIISRSSGIITGSAPGAELIPLRAVNSVVIGAGRAVAKSVDHARVNGCQIVTMSLGGPFGGRALRRAIARAVAADLIVLAASGNCVGLVVYPARDPSVIAVAAVDSSGNRWRGSCRGRTVDVSAPGENVHVATRVPGDGGGASAKSAIEKDAQGTSYAVALTAGVAALWVEKFGMTAIRAEARSRGIVVQELFRAALRKSADPRSGWDTQRMGAGIVDAEALLDLPLVDIPTGQALEAMPLIAGLTTNDVPTALEAEAGFVGSDWALRENENAASLLETALPARPTSNLAALLEGPAPENFPVPAVLLEPETPRLSLHEAIRRVAASAAGGNGLESSENVNPEVAMDRLRQEGAQRLLDDAKTALDRRAHNNAATVNSDLQSTALTRMQPIIEGMLGSGDGNLPPDNRETRAVLEALVRLTGRPALRVIGSDIDLSDPMIGEWRDELQPIRNHWRPHVRAVGRIDVEVSPGNWAHAGTGYRLADRRVITNRHVLDAFAEPLPSAPGEQRFLLRRPASIIFDANATDENTRYALPSVITAGAQRIGRYVNLNKLDLAILEMEPDNGKATPPAVVDKGLVGLTEDDITKLLVIGYPGRPAKTMGPDQDLDPQGHAALWGRIEELYGDSYGVKYISPGFVMARPGTIAGDSHNWSFTHDATTMRGNSGSAVIALQASARLAGLHFGGESQTQNFAHDLSRIRSNPDSVFQIDELPDLFE